MPERVVRVRYDFEDSSSVTFQGPDVHVIGCGARMVVFHNFDGKVTEREARKLREHAASQNKQADSDQVGRCLTLSGVLHD